MVIRHSYSAEVFENSTSKEGSTILHPALSILKSIEEALCLPTPYSQHESVKAYTLEIDSFSQTVFPQCFSTQFMGFAIASQCGQRQKLGSLTHNR